MSSAPSIAPTVQLPRDAGQGQDDFHRVEAFP